LVPFHPLIKSRRSLAWNRMRKLGGASMTLSRKRWLRAIQRDLSCFFEGHKILGARAGWDTHGLPVELEVHRELGLHGKPDSVLLSSTRLVRRALIDISEIGNG
jgi:hypothetical protein